MSLPFWCPFAIAHKPHQRRSLRDFGGSRNDLSSLIFFGGKGMCCSLSSRLSIS